MSATTSPLPRIVRFDGRKDSGEYGNATCPHCGADGRYVFNFRCDDGTNRGAMAGCIKKFPVAPIANAHRSLIEKAAERAKKEWSLASWDLKALAAIESYYEGETTEGDALRALDVAKSAARAYQAKRYGRR